MLLLVLRRRRLLLLLLLLRLPQLLRQRYDGSDRRWDACGAFGRRLLDGDDDDVGRRLRWGFWWGFG